MMLVEIKSLEILAFFTLPFLGENGILFTKAKEKGYYIPAQQATPEEIATVKQQMSQG